MSAPHLVVIRGNSASGKSTLARELQVAMGRGTALVGQDHFRRVVLRERDLPDADNIGLIRATVEHCLGIGYHVILEGILVEQHYGDMLRDLLAGHDGPGHNYYLDLPVEITLRRHVQRAWSAEVPAARLRDWWIDRDLLGARSEMVLDATRPTADLVARVLADLGPIVPRPEPTGGLFL